MPRASIELHRVKFDRVEAQVRQLNGLLGAFVGPPSDYLH